MQQVNPISFKLREIDRFLSELHTIHLVPSDPWKFLKFLWAKHFNSLWKFRTWFLSDFEILNLNSTIHPAPGMHSNAMAGVSKDLKLHGKFGSVWLINNDSNNIQPNLKKVQIYNAFLFVLRPCYHLGWVYTV